MEKQILQTYIDSLTDNPSTIIIDFLRFLESTRSTIEPSSSGTVVPTLTATSGTSSSATIVLLSSASIGPSSSVTIVSSFSTSSGPCTSSTIVPCSTSATTGWSG
ncbi:uncharacterized protein LOC136087846 isoform X3 [Hydra vulgaris]|uniref:Uncharacterized protein LOC136087846 isoform X3 n=1 Tax=Hydra vulgaris TaxID=6087 RepID=A0ABM4CZX8_HYDVU